MLIKLHKDIAYVGQTGCFTMRQRESKFLEFNFMFQKVFRESEKYTGREKNQVSGRSKQNKYNLMYRPNI
jgi:hypothetical protein